MKAEEDLLEVEPITCKKCGETYYQIRPARPVEQRRQKNNCYFIPKSDLSVSNGRFAVLAEGKPWCSNIPTICLCPHN